MTARINFGMQEREEVSMLLDTIDGGNWVRMRKGKQRKMKAGINMYTAMASGLVPDLMEIEPARFLG